MCGIFGWQLSERFDRSLAPGTRAVLAAGLAIGNDDRGGDSWGYAVPGAAVPVVKGLGDIVRASMSLASHRSIMAHTRKATTGRVCAANSHPFRAGRILGAHNGMIANHDELNATLGRACVVDSEHLIRHLDEGRDFGEIRGYGALEWTEDGVPGVHLCRMRQGVLSIAAFDYDGKTGAASGSIWSSDSDHLYRALRAAGIARRRVMLLHAAEGSVIHMTAEGVWITSRRIEIGAPIYVARKWYEDSRWTPRETVDKATGNPASSDLLKMADDMDMTPTELSRMLANGNR